MAQARPEMVAADDHTPIPHPEIIAAFAAAPGLVGRTIKVEWTFAEGEMAGLRTKWDGRVLGYGAVGSADAGKVKIFYWRGQDRFPRLNNNVPGLEVFLPRTGVQYWKLTITDAVPAGDAELQHNMEEAAREQVEYPEPVITDVSTWRMIGAPGGMGAEVMKNKVALYGGVSVSSSARRTSCYDSIVQWIDTAKTLDCWEDVPAFVALGNSLMSTLRITIAEENLRVTADDIRRAMRQENEGDPLEQAIAKVQKEGSKAGGKAGFRKCSSCGKVGHTAGYCWARDDGGKKPTKPDDGKGKNGVGSAGTRRQ